MNNLTSSIKKITEKCVMFDVKNVLFQGWFTPLGLMCLYLRVHVLILDFCRRNCVIYIDNRNNRSDNVGTKLVSKVLAERL